MSLYLLKPIVWNAQGYLKPAGGKFSSGYPKENGFGHEEWNAAPHWQFEEAGRQWRCFHTEHVSDERLQANAGEVVVFMIASHEGSQYLVGVAGGATNLVDQRAERNRLVALLGTASEERAEEAWSVAKVRTAFMNDKAKFMKKWQKEAHWGPTWRCPSDQFLWLERPVKLDPMEIAGKSRLVTMYSTFQSLSRHQASLLLSRMEGNGYRGKALAALERGLAADPSALADDIDEIQARKQAGPTTKEALIQARIGQGAFRARLEGLWKGCAVTGCTHPAVLRASHIKPWRIATDKERLDVANGFLLLANLDALFDRGHISFSDEGAVLFSPGLSPVHRMELGLTEEMRLRKPLVPSTQKYLQVHRRKYGFSDDL